MPTMMLPHHFWCCPVVWTKVCGSGHKCLIFGQGITGTPATSRKSPFIGIIFFTIFLVLVALFVVCFVCGIIRFIAQSLYLWLFPQWCAILLFLSPFVFFSIWAVTKCWTHYMKIWVYLLSFWRISFGKAKWNTWCPVYARTMTGIEDTTRIGIIKGARNQSHS